MHSLFTASQTTTTKPIEKSYKPEYIYICQLHTGEFCIGQASNPSKRISSLNSGCHPAVKRSLAVNRVVGVKPQTKERNFAGVVKTFCDRYGASKVIAL